MQSIILLVDDDFSNLKIAKQLLSPEYKVVALSSGQEAIEYLYKKNADLILLDLNMPEMSGEDVMKKIRRNPNWSKIPVIFLTAETSAATEVECFVLGAVDFIAKPFIPEVVLSRIGRAIELEYYRRDLETRVTEQTAEILEMQNKVLNMQQEVMKMQQEVINSMANLIESRDGSTGEHVKRTNSYVKMIVEELINQGKYLEILTEDYIFNLSKAAAMHDIGKITVPDSILQKPGKLTTDEFEIMKRHSKEGGRIIRNTMGKIENREYIEMAYDVAVFHHEKWDGTGYPDGLKGQDIPLSARIMAVADVFDALISERCYKEAMSIDDAFKIIEASSGEHFDREIVDAFLNIRQQIEAMIQGEGYESEF